MQSNKQPDQKKQTQTQQVSKPKPVVEQKTTTIKPQTQHQPANSTKQPVKTTQAPKQTQQNAPVKQNKNVEVKNQQKPQAPKAQQHEESKQVVQQIQVPKAQIKGTINLKEIINQNTKDKQENKVSFFLDTTGNVYTFYKYKGEVLDISLYLVQLSQGKMNKQEVMEHVRKTMVGALKMGGFLVIYIDEMRPDLTDFFKQQPYFDNPSNIFNYKMMLDEKFYKQKILKPEEDVDTFGNKGWFKAKEEDFKICLVCNVKENPNPEEILKQLGLEKIQDVFNPWVVEI